MTKNLQLLIIVVWKWPIFKGKSTSKWKTNKFKSSSRIIILQNSHPKKMVLL